MVKRFLLVLLGVALAASLIVGCGTPGGAKQNMQAGTYRATVPGMQGALSVEVTVSPSAITSVRVTDHVETPGLADWPVELIPARIVEHQSLAVDVLTGATLTSRAILFAAEDCLRQAGANIDALLRPIRTPRVRDQTLRADVIIVGGGGAGLAAAVEATEAGASVIVVEKAGFLGGNTIVARGGIQITNTTQQSTLLGSPGLDRLITDAVAENPINEDMRAMQNRVRAEFEAFRRTNPTALFDSPTWHALQTFIGGDRIASLPIIYIMTSNALNTMQWLENMGVELQAAATQGAGVMYPRSHRAALPNGIGYFRAFRSVLDTRNNYTQLMETRATGLIVERGRVVGVNAVGKQGNRITLRANNGVILATGGFAGNVELRQQYCEGGLWPYLGPTLITTNVETVTGDGHFFARDAGAHLVNMEHLQLFQEANPITGAINDGAAPFGVAGYLMINREGRRFVNEGGRRDDICLAMLAQPGGMAFIVQSSESISNPNTVRTHDGRTVTFMLENNLSGYVTANTLEELARLLGMPSDNLVRTVAAYNAAVDARLTSDEFGRANLTRRIATGPWYAYPRAPATHYTMGGVLIDEYTRALREDGSVIPGLFCAGEITGVIHGTNRLGGNAFTDIFVFGRIAGRNAAAGR